MTMAPTRPFCSNCMWREVKARGLCRNCHEYIRTTGRPRPADVIRKDLKRNGA